MCARLDVRHGKKGVKKGKRNPDYKEVVAKVADLRGKKKRKKKKYIRRKQEEHTHMSYRGRKERRAAASPTGTSAQRSRQ
jgi:hypothetical protein